MAERHVALYRKYRSQNFEELVGQNHVVRTLRNSIERGKIAHAYLFTGPRGTGKTSTARLLAKALNCTGGPSADIPADCPICAEITSGSCMDVIELDAASESGVDKVRQHIVEASEYQPANCRFKVFIIDEVHDLSAKAFDALLKTIEEPPAHVVFILATTEYHKVPPTIRSRCQKFEFHRGTVKDLSDRLQFVAQSEGIEIEPAALVAISRLADGGFRDALTLLEQAAVTADGSVTLHHVYDQLGLIVDEVSDGLLGAVADCDEATIVRELEDIYRTGRDPQAILESLMHRLSDLTRGALHIEDSSERDASVEAALTSTATRIGRERLLDMRSAMSEIHRDLRDVSLPRLWLEAQMVRIARMLAKRTAPARVPQVHATTPQPEAPAASVVREKAAVTPEPAKAAVEAEEPATPPAEPTNDQERWAVVVDHMSRMSKAAAGHLLGSRVTAVTGNVVTVALMRVVSVDWVTGKLAVQQEIRAQWKAVAGVDADFEFVGPELGKKRPSAPVEATSVESRLEGDRAADAARGIFGTADSN